MSLSTSSANSSSSSSSPLPEGVAAPSQKELEAAEQIRSRQHRRCNRIVDTALANDFYTKWLMQALTNSGCAVSRAFVQCAPCDVAGFFDKSAGVTLCQNQFDNFTDNHVTRVLRHELTHAYDFCRADLSTSNCLHVACTEIRASMLSGECSASQEALRLQLPLTVSRHFPACVRRRALLSLEGHPHCKAIAAQAVDAAWNRCYNDQEPFDHRP